MQEQEALKILRTNSEIIIKEAEILKGVLAGTDYYCSVSHGAKLLRFFEDLDH